MASLNSTEDFYRYKALHYEALVGDKKDREYLLESMTNIEQSFTLKFEAALDIPADSLLKLQMKYNMHTARKDNALVEKLKQIRKVAAIL